MTINYNISTSEYPGEVCLCLFHNSCNLKCPWCFNYNSVNEPLTFKIVKKSIKENLDYISAVSLSGGEPLTIKHFKKIAKYIRDSGLKLKINTNGLIPVKAKVDYLNISIKGCLNDYKMCGYPNFISPLENIFLNTALNRGYTEWSIVYHKDLVDTNKLSSWLCNTINNNCFKSFCKPDLLSLIQFQNDNCLNDNLKQYTPPTNFDLRNEVLKFKNIPLKHLEIETKEFGREKLKIKEI